PVVSLEEMREVAGDGSDDGEIDPGRGPEAEAVAKDEAGRILKALLALDERAQQIVWLRFWERWSVRRIAELLGVSRPRVCSLAARALEQLRAHLGEDGESGAGE